MSRAALAVSCFVVSLPACTDPPPATSPPDTGNPAGAGGAPIEAGGRQFESLRAEVVARWPHDSGAFTQGLVWHQGRFFESTGLYGSSSLREVEVASGIVRRRHDVARAFFGEGLARVDGQLIQLTWRENTAFVYDLETFEPRPRLTYPGEGWGLCHDGSRLVMSDGSAVLRFRDPGSFAEINRQPVTRSDGVAVGQLNELECVDAHVYANVWQTDSILRIDADTGVVTAVIDASGLLTPVEARSADVLNGIAHDPDSGSFFVTGKLWPWVFEVRFVP